MKWHPVSWSIILPDPYRPDGQWELVDSYKSEAAAIAALQALFGADEQGRIGLISHIDREGWLVDLPNPTRPEDAWVFVEAFKRKRDAVRFVKKHYFGDSEGRIRPIDVMEGEGGPKDWSPTGEIVEYGGRS